MANRRYLAAEDDEATPAQKRRDRRRQRRREFGYKPGFKGKNFSHGSGGTYSPGTRYPA